MQLTLNPFCAFYFILLYSSYSILRTAAASVTIFQLLKNVHGDRPAAVLRTNEGIDEAHLVARASSHITVITATSLFWTTLASYSACATKVDKKKKLQPPPFSVRAP